jgi:hypothetical protein
MDRGSSKHSPRVDEQMADEVEGIVHGVAGARAEEWKSPEPSGEDQPEVTIAPDDGYGLGEPAGVGNPEAEDLSRFASYIGRSALPGNRAKLEKSARDLDAPDDVLDRLGKLDPGATYRTITEVWQATR